MKNKLLNYSNITLASISKLSFDLLTPLKKSLALLFFIIKVCSNSLTPLIGSSFKNTGEPKAAYIEEIVFLSILKGFARSLVLPLLRTDGNSENITINVLALCVTLITRLCIFVILHPSLCRCMFFKASHAVLPRTIMISGSNLLISSWRK